MSIVPVSCGCLWNLLHFSFDLSKATLIKIVHSRHFFNINIKVSQKHQEGEVVLVPAFLQEVLGQQERLLEEAEWSCVEAPHRQNYLVNLPMTMTSCDSPPAF